MAWSSPGSKRGGSSRSLAPWNDLCILIDKVKLVSASQLAVLKYKEEAVWQTQRRHTEGGRKEGAGGGQGGGRRWPVADSRKPRRVQQRQPITVSLPQPYRLPHTRDVGSDVPNSIIKDGDNTAAIVGKHMILTSTIECYREETQRDAGTEAQQQDHAARGGEGPL
jgi:hypothetical protein